MKNRKPQITKDKRQQNPKRILFIGDIIGEVGRDAIKKRLADLRTKHDVGFVVANGEHLSERVGVEPNFILEMRAAGIDFFTSGNHVFKRDAFKEEIGQRNMPITRPANFLLKQPGHGFRVVTTPIGKILLINLLGKEGIKERVTNPFKKVDEILRKQEDYDYSLVDFHAEMSSEKVAMGYHLDGRVTAVLGTHTHVPTADARIMPGGTAFVSDVGMCGPLNSVLGVKSEIIVDRFIDGAGAKFELADGPAVINSVLITLGKKGLAKEIKRIDEIFS